ncbi:MAG TPA: cytochrome P450 [Streptosporangiaceae bacterium]|nr:cytochrome P450 [Streptosporangiaceae bacterium]
MAFSPYDYRIHEDPYPVYARLRDEAPLYRNSGQDFWALSRHKDVVDAFRDPTRFSSANGVSLDPAAWGPYAHKTMSFLALDPPRHTRMRALVSRGFTARRVRELEHQIRALARRHLDAAVARGDFDFVADFAGLLPMDVISEMIGVPETDRDDVRKLADTVVHRDDGLFDVPQAGMEAALTLVGYYADLLAQRRAGRAGSAADQGDLTSALLEAEIDGDRLTDDEIIGFLFLMVVAGNETTTKLLSNAVYWAWRNPAELAKPMADPGRIADWVSETLRYDASSQVIARTVAEGFTAHGQTVPAGGRLLLLIGSANRDPAVFPAPDGFDLDRDTSALISFGSGRHYCLGANLARLEAQIALAEFTRLVAAYDIDDGRAQRVHSVNVRGFASLPMHVRVR